MQDLLHRLYKTKLQLIAVVMTFLGAGFLVLARWESGATDHSWADSLPLTDFGSALLTTGLLAVAFEYFDRKDGDERATRRLRQVLREEAPAIRDAVVDGFASNAKALEGVASPELLDRLATNALALRLKDPELAAQVYTDLRDQIIRAPERWRDVRASVALFPWEQGPAPKSGAMFVATVSWEYRVKLGSPRLRFACTSDLHEYRELLNDPSVTAVWYFEPNGELHAGSPEVFELPHCSIDGQELPARRTSRKDSQHYTVNAGDGYQPEKEVTISFTYRALVRDAGHLLYLDIPRPAHGLHVQFWYGSTPIRYVNVLDFIASAERARIVRSPRDAPSPSVEVGFDGWVFPRSGVAFVWVLDAELPETQKGDNKRKVHAKKP